MKYRPEKNDFILTRIIQVNLKETSPSKQKISKMIRLVVIHAYLECGRKE